MAPSDLLHKPLGGGPVTKFLGSLAGLALAGTGVWSLLLSAGRVPSALNPRNPAEVVDPLIWGLIMSGAGAWTATWGGWALSEMLRLDLDKLAPWPRLSWGAVQLAVALLCAAAVCRFALLPGAGLALVQSPDFGFLIAAVPLFFLGPVAQAAMLLYPPSGKLLISALEKAALRVRGQRPSGG